MFDIYWNDDCLHNDFENEDAAYKVLEKIIKIHHLKFLAGGADGPNSWGVYLQLDCCGFPSYQILSIRKNDYKHC
jgi:hypothetical protein